MTLIEARNLFRNSLNDLYLQAEIDALFKSCIAHYFQWESTKVGLAPQQQLKPDEEAIISATLEKLQTATPLQYILGETIFCGLKLKVAPAVLIPRPETEELVEWILEEQNQDRKTVVDLCTGSGCIALALAKQRPSWQLTAVDVSAEALEIAKENSNANSLKVNWKEADVLMPALTLDKCDCIVSNPPYVLPSEIKKMHANVLQHEPALALFVPEENPLLFYDAILQLGRKTLKPNGVIYFEINPLCSDQLINLGNQLGYAYAEIKKDIFGKARFIKFRFIA